MLKKITMKKDGHIAIGLLAAFLLILVVVIAMFGIEIFFLNLKAEKTQDDIVLSNLASYKDIDKLGLAESTKIFRIGDPNAAFNTFKFYLEKNMLLDSNLNGLNHSIAVGKVNIKQYIIYNIAGNTAQIYTLDPKSNIFTETNITDITLNPVYNPDGVSIKNTSIYTVLNINFDVALKGILGNTRSADVKATTDIKN